MVSLCLIHSNLVACPFLSQRGPQMFVSVRSLDPFSPPPVSLALMLSEKHMPSCVHARGVSTDLERKETTIQQPRRNAALVQLPAGN